MEQVRYSYRIPECTKGSRLKHRACSQVRPALCNQRDQPSIKEIQQGGLIKTVCWKQADMNTATLMMWLKSVAVSKYNTVSDVAQVCIYVAVSKHLG